jgi:dolichyl-phosphate beta-glucosyltransferase
MGTAIAATDGRTECHPRRETAPPASAAIDHDLTVILPAFNEEGRLPWTLAELGLFLDDWGVDYRVMVADDGSSDRTPQLTDVLGRRFSTCVLDKHRGKGCAVRTAMLRATGRVVAFTDADLPFDLASLRECFSWIDKGQCEVVFGARDLEQSANIARRHLARTLATLTFRQLVKRLISREVTDTQCGLKLFSHHAAGEIFSRATIDGFAFDTEVVLLTERLGLAYRRLPVTLIHEYGSTLSLRRHTLPMVWDIARLWLRSRGGRLPRRSIEQPREGPREKRAA